VRRRRLLRTVPAATVAALAGCLGGGDGEGSGNGDGGAAAPTATPRPTDTPSPSPTAEPTDTPTATATAEPTDTPTATATATPTPAADLTVTVGPDSRLVFEPRTFELAAGETVRWEWASPGHNVSPEGQPSGADWPGDDGTTYGSGHAYAYTFTVPGSYEYHCDPHQSVGMRGSFTVR
jgi:plastocyanin